MDIVAVYVRITNGNIGSYTSRRLIEKLRPVIADDVRITINQGLQFRYVKPEHLEYVYSVLERKDLPHRDSAALPMLHHAPATIPAILGSATAQVSRRPLPK
jgi:sulfite reductase (ferredoxin)